MSYMHIDNLYKDQRVLLFKEVYAMEKVHGTSANVSWNGYRLIFFSGGEKHENFIKLFDHEKLTQQFKEQFDGISVRICGEAYGGKQQGMSDFYGKQLQFIAFEVKIGESWLDVPNAEQVATRFGLEFVPYKKVPATLEALDAERDADSEIAIRRGMGTGHMREGIVIRPMIEVRDNAGARIMAKHKRDEFRETATPRSAKPVDEGKQKVLDDAESIALEWVTTMRLHHVLDSLRAEVQREPGIEDTGRIVKMMVEDVEREGRDEVILTKEGRKAIGSAAARMFKKMINDALYGKENQ